MALSLGPDGYNLIKSFEGLQLKAYKCPAGILTIGYGHTGADVKDGMQITQSQADDLLQNDVSKFEKGVNRIVTQKLTQHQFDALVSFAFNLGLGNLQTSTLLKKLNDGDYNGAADEFPKWNKAGGVVLSGLTKRRLAEQKLFKA